MKDNRYFSDQLYGDVLLSYSHTFNDFLVSATAGWDGSEGVNPGFPKDGKWNVRWEGLKPLP